MIGTAAHISGAAGPPVKGPAGIFVAGPPDPDGICHCDPQPESSPIGECPRCRRLDIRKAFA